MGYSRRRIFILGAAFLLVGAGFVVVAPNSHYLSNPDAYGTVLADEHNCQPDSHSSNDHPPCMFPAETGTGGIIMGATYLDGEYLSTWLSEEGGITDDTDCYEDADRTCIQRTTSPGRVVSQEPVVGIGLNNLNVQNFFAYKSWRDTTPSGAEFYTYFWMASDTATLRGRVNLLGSGAADECLGTGDSGNIHFSWGRQTCDLMAEASETGLKTFYAEADSSGGSQTLQADNWWMAEPEKDQCNVDIWQTSATCLGMLEAGSYGQDKLDNVYAEFEAFALKTHRVSAVPSPSTLDSPPISKELVMNDVYLEMRYGKGTDTAKVPRRAAYPNNLLPLLQNGTGSAQDRRERMSMDYACDGNPLGTGMENCYMSAGTTQIGVTDTMYEDIHR